MKKFIAISAALALVAGSAFADVTWSGVVETTVVVVQGDDDDDSHLTGVRPGGLARLQASVTRENSIGLFGAMARVGAAPGAGANADGHIWWEPVDMFRLGMGTAMGGFVDTIGRQGFNRGGTPGTVVSLASEGAIGYGRPFMGNDGAGFSARLRPMGDMLHIGVHLPYPTADRRTYQIFAGTGTSAGMRVGVHADLDFGRIGFGYAANLAGTTFDWWDEDEDEFVEFGLRDAHSIFAMFRSTTLVDGLGLDFGVRFGFGGEDPFSEDDDDESFSFSHLDLGVGVNFAVTDTIDIRFRGTFGLALGDLSDIIGPRMGFELEPSILVTPDVRFSLNAGVGIDLPGSEFDDEDPLVYFMVNPYVRVNLSGPAFGVGFHVRGTNDGDNTTIRWGVPIGMVFSF